MIANEILALHKSGHTMAEITALLKVSPKYVRKVITGAWQQGLPMGVADPDYLSTHLEPQPKHRSKRSIRTETVKAIRASQGWASATQVAEEHGVSASAVRRIWGNETYREVR